MISPYPRPTYQIPKALKPTKRAKAKLPSPLPQNASQWVRRLRRTIGQLQRISARHNGNAYDDDIQSIAQHTVIDTLSQYNAFQYSSAQLLVYMRKAVWIAVGEFLRMLEQQATPLKDEVIDMNEIAEPKIDYSTLLSDETLRHVNWLIENVGSVEESLIVTSCYLDGVKEKELAKQLGTDVHTIKNKKRAWINKARKFEVKQ